MSFIINFLTSFSKEKLNDNKVITDVFHYKQNGPEYELYVFGKKYMSFIDYKAFIDFNFFLSCMLVLLLRPKGIFYRIVILILSMFLLTKLVL